MNPADLDAIADEARADEAQQSAPPAPGAAEPSAALAQEIAGLVMMAVAAVSPALPSLQTIYTPQVTAAAAGAVARVCVKHGWLPDGIAGKWGEEIAAAMILVPLGVQTWQAVKRDVEVLKAKAAGQKGAVIAPQSLTGPQPPAGDGAAPAVATPEDVLASPVAW